MSTMCKKKSLASLFATFLKVGFIGFGGGSALIPVIERELIREDGEMSSDEYIKHTVIANITPGALPPKLGATCGYQLGGVGGALVSAYAVSLPGVLLTVLIMSMFSIMGGSAIHYFNYASVGITVFIVFLLVSYVIKTLKLGNLKMNLALCFISFLLTCGKELRHIGALLLGLDSTALGKPLFDISTINLMLLTFAGIAIVSLISKKSPKPKVKMPHIPKDIWITMAVFIAIPILLTLLASVAAPPSAEQSTAGFAANVAASTVTSFGGGEAYVSVADGIFVQGGYIEPEIYYTRLVPVANALPGPILIKIASGIGYLVGSGSSLFGWLLAAVAMTTALGCCCAVSILVMQLYDSIGHSAFIQNLKRYILPVICGMLLSTSASMLYESLKITSEKQLAPVVVLPLLLLAVPLLSWLHKRFHLHDLVLLLLSAGVGLLLLMAL